MDLSRCYSSDSFGISIEVFPPKTPQGDQQLFQTLDQLRPYQPRFVSCTYGAGGSTRARTLDICREIGERTGLHTTAHLTCVGATPEQLVEWLSEARRLGVANIMALRGDAPKDRPPGTAPAGGLEYAKDLVELIRANFPEFGIGVAGYPEKHPEAKCLDTDMSHLKAKVDAGADAIYTQLFFVNDHFFRFRERAERAGIRVPIVPGVMPLTDQTQVGRVVALSGADVPTSLRDRLRSAGDDLEAQCTVGVEHAIEQCSDLRRQGAPGLHFYALNKARACERILAAMDR